MGSSGTLGDSVMRTLKDTFSGLSKGTKKFWEKAVVSIVTSDISNYTNSRSRNAFSGSPGTLGDSVMRTQKDTFSGLLKSTKYLWERASIDK